MSVRKIGVEEELMLVDPVTGLLAAVSHRALRAHEEGHDTQGAPRAQAGPEGDHDVELELFLQQIETATAPCHTLPDLDRELRRCRRAVGEAARSAGSRAVAVATPVLDHEEGRVAPKPRYRRIRDEFGEMSRQSVLCGMHVHVDISGDEEGVGVIDRIRPWLPVLLAISANSPYWRGHDTGYASWRSQLWGRWPTAGPADPFGDARGYQAVAQGFIDSGAALDRGMLYFDARLAESYSTVEVRIADVCTEAEDALLVAAMTRALVDTAARHWISGEPPIEWRTDLLKAAHWRAARYGVGDRLVHPAERCLVPAREAFKSLLHHTRDALDDAHDTDVVTDAFEHLLARGAGASRQRAVAEAQGALTAVVADLVDRTEGSWLRR